MTKAAVVYKPYVHPTVGEVNLEKLQSDREKISWGTKKSLAT